MATNVYMEALSPTMEEGRVVKWLKRDGDPVKTGETLAEVETDKAVMDLVARADGVLRQVAAAEGQTVAVGSVVAVIAAPGEAITAAAASAPKPVPAPPSGSAERGAVPRRPPHPDPQDYRQTIGDVARSHSPFLPHDRSGHGAGERGAGRPEPAAGRSGGQSLVQRPHHQGDRASAHQASGLQCLVPGGPHPLLERGAYWNGGGGGGRAHHARDPERGAEVARRDRP